MNVLSINDRFQQMELDIPNAIKLCGVDSSLNEKIAILVKDVIAYMQSIYHERNANFEILPISSFPINAWCSASIEANDYDRLIAMVVFAILYMKHIEPAPTIGFIDRELIMSKSRLEEFNSSSVFINEENISTEEIYQNIEWFCSPQGTRENHLKLVKEIWNSILSQFLKENDPSFCSFFVCFFENIPQTLIEEWFAPVLLLTAKYGMKILDSKHPEISQFLSVNHSESLDDFIYFALKAWDLKENDQPDFSSLPFTRTRFGMKTFLLILQAIRMNINNKEDVINILMKESSNIQMNLIYQEQTENTSLIDSERWHLSEQNIKDKLFISSKETIKF